MFDSSCQDYGVEVMMMLMSEVRPVLGVAVFVGSVVVEVVIGLCQ